MQLTPFHYFSLSLSLQLELVRETIAYITHLESILSPAPPAAAAAEEDDQVSHAGWLGPPSAAS